MAEFSSYPHGSPSWIDLGTSDVAAAKAFYSSVFGWKADDQPSPQGPPYTMFTKNGKNVAGAMALTPQETGMGVPPHWNTYIAVDDVEDTVARVAGAGGTVIVGAMDIPDAGRMAWIADSTGAMLGLWQANQHIGAELANEDGTFGWSELVTDDPAAAQKFYADVLGWTFQTMATPNGDYHVAQSGDRAFAGIMEKPPTMAGMPNVWGVYIYVDDAGSTIDAIKANGGTVIMEPWYAEGVGDIAVVADPQGAVFTIMRPDAVPD